ncbi:hypothetical protein RMSM_02222 [Rhodopirellula maiorica SM1]|uniref:Uncharacterized protein n=1 Tax=Rhodopirellula maiorica SM1 TaxID=1265738 RepID=M5RNG6_9BACT|nr:hypothetical protein RMSM_02222 [Rhodopirellula maiorica SM1]
MEKIHVFASNEVNQVASQAKLALRWIHISATQQLRIVIGRRPPSMVKGGKSFQR